MKKIVLCFLSLTAATVAFAQTDAIKQYVDAYSAIAINEMVRTGVPAAITLAQGIVESQAGQSDLVKSSNNHFGIKCKEEWTGDCVYHDDDLKNECFRVYGSAEESFRDHSDFLKSRPYYTDLFNINPADYKAWARGLKKAGYATERDYPQMLIKMIEENGLQQYTIVALERMKDGGDVAYVANNSIDGAQQAPAQQVVNDSSNVNPAPPQQSHLQNAIDRQEQQQAVASSSTANDAAIDTYPTGPFVINHRKVIYAQAGTSLLALANKYNTSLASLLEFNDLSKKRDVLKEDRLIFLQKKLTKGEKEYHIAARHETMEDIAQTEGVRLENLLQYNNMKKGGEPAAGRKIYLRTAVASSHTAKSSKSAALAKASRKKKHKQQNA